MQPPAVQLGAHVTCPDCGHIDYYKFTANGVGERWPLLAW